MANTIKLRLEVQLEAGDLVTPQDALAVALDALATRWGAAQTAPTHEVVEVPRGQAAYMVEVRYGK